MPNRRIGGLRIAGSLVLLLLLITCKNPFQSGLGDKVDIDRPIVTLDAPDPGDFLRETVVFSGTATDDTAVKTVRISFDRGSTWLEVNSYNPATNRWEHSVDTRVFDNGRLNVIIRVIDTSGKQTTTEELLFTVDNEGPRIFVLVPSFSNGSATVAAGGIIAGTVTDVEGVYVGAAQDELFPPQIKFWSASDSEPSDWSNLDIQVNEGNTKADFTFPLTGLPAGEFFMRVRAFDVSGQSSLLPPSEEVPVTVEIIAGQGPPTLSGFAFGPEPTTVKTVGGNNYTATDFSFTVIASDDEELATVTVTRYDGDTPLPVDDSDPDVTLTIDWTGDPQNRAELTLVQSVGGGEGLSDGVYEYRIRATNALTLASELSRTVVVDTTPPEVEITNLRPVVVDDSDPLNIVETVNGTIRVNVAAGDENGLTGVKWWLLPAAAAAPGYDSDGATPFGASPYMVEIDSNDFADETGHTLHIIARDRAGNDTLVSRDFIIDQSSDYPTVTFTDIDPSVTEETNAGVGGVNLLESNARVRGVIEDDDRVDRSSVQIRLNVGDGGDWVAVDSVGQGERSVSFTHNVDNLGEGVHSFELSFSDDPTAKLGSSPSAATTTVGLIWFVIDTAPPALAITSPGAGSFQGGPFDLSGTASDANGLERHNFGGAIGDSEFVEIAAIADPGSGDPPADEDWVKAAVDSDTANWSYPVAADSGLFDGEGERVLLVRARDRFGKQTAAQLSFQVDNQPPEVTIDFPVEGDWLAGSSGTIQGNASDEGSGVAEVRVWVGEQSAEPPADTGEWILAAGTANWSAAIDLNAFTEGPKTAHVVARDAAGNWSEESQQRGFTIDQAPPTFENFAFDEGTVNTVAGTHYAGGDFGFSVTAVDSNALANVTISRDGTTVFNADYSSTSELIEYSESVGGAGLDDGVYEYVITARDVAEKTAVLTRTVVVDTTPPVVSLNSLNPLVSIAGVDYVNSTIRFTVSASDDSGLTGVRWWLLPAADPQPGFDSDDWTAFGAAPYVATADTTLFTVQPEYTLYIIARDRAGNDSLVSRDITIDQDTDIPVVVVTHPASGAYVDAGYLVRGTVSDDDAVDPASVEVRYHDGSDWSAWQPTTVTGSGREVTFSYELPPGLGTDGAKQVQARAADLASAKFGGDAAASGTSAAVAFTLDTLSPVLSISDPPQNATFRQEFSLAGEVVEANLETVRVSVNGAAPVSASVSGENETKAWSFDISEAHFLSWDEGPSTISVEAIDRVGRNHLLQRVVFKDTTGPVISFSSIVNGENTILTESTPTVRGGFADEFSNVGAGFEYRLNATDEADPWQSDGTVSGSGKTVNWAVPVAGLDDGSHTIDIRVADVLGNSSSVEAVAFRIDRVAPQISVSEPPSGTIYGGVASGTVFTLSGSAGDANLVSVTAQLAGGPVEDVIAGEIENGVAQWVLDVTQDDFAPLPEGTQSVHVTALDAAGRSTEIAWSFVKDSNAPEVFINSLEGDGSTVLMEASPRVQGSASDDHGVSLVESRIERFDYAAGEWESYNRDTSGWDSGAPLEDQQYWGELTIPANQNVVTWTKRLGSDGLNLADGRYRVAIRAYDRAQPEPNELLTDFTLFHIDRANPALGLDPSGSFQNADFQLSGTASDANTIAAVRAKVGDGDFAFGTVAEATTSNGYASWTVEVPTDGLALGSHTVYVQAEDGAGRTATLTREFNFDGVPPTVSINEPINETRVNGLVTVRGTSDDNNAVALVQYRIGNNATTWQTAGLGGGLYSWNYTFSNINTYANTSDVTEVNPATGDPEPGTNVWALPFQVRVTDVAGNVTEELDYRLFVDPDMDAPQVTIVSPTNDQIVGGSVRVSGFASDDDWVRRVEIRIDPTGTGTAYEPWQNATLINQGTQVNWFHNINTSGELNPAPGTIRDVRVQVRAVDSKDFGLSDGITGDITEINVKFDSGVPSIENIEIVRNGEVTPYAPGVRAAGTFLVRATVKDEGGIASIRWRGEGQPYSEILDDPAITTPPSEVSAGSFEVDRKYLITNIGSTDFVAIGASSNTVGISFTATGVGSGTGTAFEATGPVGQPDQQFFVYTMELEIDSETVNGGAYAGTSGFYSLDIQATDNATPTPYLTQVGLNIQIDNFFPSGEYTSSPNAATANYFIQGRASDVGDGSGSIQGVDRVVVYFFRNGEYISLTGGAFNGTTRMVRDMTAGGALQSVPFPADDGGSGIVINNNEVTVDLDDNGYIEGWTDDGIYKNWYVIFDTNQLPDGPVDLNYVVIDRAGNATRYVQPLYIRNNAPQITGVVLGTDVDGDGVIGEIPSGESRFISANYGTTNFTVRNNRLSFSIEAESGNLPRRYSVGYVTSSVSVAPDALLRGAVYTIATPGDTNWTLAGAPSNSAGTTFVASGPGQGNGTATGYTLVEQNSELTAAELLITDFSGIPDTESANGARFVIKVYDSTVSGGDEVDQLADAVLIGMNIDNVDTVAPTITVAPFGRRYTVPASNRDQDKLLVDVDQYIENIVTTGSGSSVQRHGYAQYAEHSANGRPDLSGRVIFLGKAADNQRIARITAQIADFDPDGVGPLAAGAEFDIAVWDGGGLAAAGGHTVAEVAAGNSDWGFDVVGGSQAITEANGHVLNWRFAWNSAAIENVAQLDVPVTFRVYDFGPGDGNDDHDTIDVDVVPYISRIETPRSNLGGLKATNIRASDGEYSIRSGAIAGFSDSFITVRGFNLSPITDGVRIAPETTPSGLDGVSLTGVPLSFNAPDAGFTTLTLSNDSTVSGYLGIVSGTPAAPVAAVNNINDNSADYNQEPDEFVRRNTTFTDDRFLRFFAVTDTGIANANYPNMVMDDDTPYFGYIQSGANFDLQVRRGFSSADNTPIVRTLAADQMAMVRDDGGRYHMISVTNFGGGRMHHFFHEYATLYQGANGRDGGGNNGASQPYWAGFGGANTSFTAQAANNAIDLDSTSYDPGAQLGRYQRPVIRTLGDSTTADGASIYLAVFDSFSGELIFRNWRVGQNLTGGTADLSGSYRSTLADRGMTSGDATRQIVATGGNASEYFDMVVRDDGVVVLGYYNPSISRFTVRFSTTTDGGSTPQPIDGLNPAAPVLWSEPFMLPNEFVGWFPSMALHSDDSLHIAAYDSGGANLTYIYMDAIDATSADVVTVDNYGSVGYYNDLKIYDGVPWIAYYSISETGTRDSVKLARFNGTLPAITAGVDEQGFVTGDWTTMTIPVASVPRGNQSQFLRVNLGFDTQGVPIVSHTGASIEYVRPLAQD